MEGLNAAAPGITLPKGGGALRAIGEKFAANPVTGTGTMTVAIATSTGRSGFGPQLSLAYNSGAGNGAFGLGWTLSTPAITRKTDTGLPRYADHEESDVFLLSGAEDLVPVLGSGGKRFEDTTTAPGFTIHRYRPRIEGLFARIERWTDAGGQVHWRSITKDNILSVYGVDPLSRIADPGDDRRVFTWLISETRDDKGNAVVYRYAAENGDGATLTEAHQRNRGPADDPGRTANRYLKRIRYGNRKSLLDEDGRRPPLLTPDLLDEADWMFEVVLDYDEDHVTDPSADAGDREFVRAALDPAKPWTHRPDAFSSYRAGFEVRTARLCRRVLMFHHFPGEPGVGQGCLVRSTDLDYLPGPYAFLREVRQYGYSRAGDRYLRQGLPPLEFGYTQPAVGDAVEEADPENLPAGLHGTGYQWVDLDSDGAGGILVEQAGAWFYKRNLSPLDSTRAAFGPLELIRSRPSLPLADAQFLDLAGDGRPDLVAFDGDLPGFYEYDRAQGWESFRPFLARPNVSLRDPAVQLVDLDGDGHADVLVAEEGGLVWHRSLAEDGFGPADRSAQSLDDERGPHLAFRGGDEPVFVADLSGDGLSDLVRIRNGEVCYWPNLGHGRFGAKVTMDGGPLFDHPDQFDPARLRFADIDGTGPTDLIYLHHDGVRLYFNRSGNGWSDAHPLPVFPGEIAEITTADLLGDGTACLVWSSPSPADVRRPLRYVRLMAAGKPHLLVRSANHVGAETRVDYAPSTRYAIADRRDGRPWLTRLGFPVHVVARVETYDQVSGNRFVSRFAYHHGHYDGEEREFRGFGLVEQWDTEEMPTSPDVADDAERASRIPPVLTRTWYHTGVHLERDAISAYFAGPPRGSRPQEYYREPGWTDADADAHLLPDTVLPDGLTPAEEREACRALKGMMLRQEVYGLDGTPEADRPYLVTEQNFTIRRMQERGDNRHAVFFAHPRESLSYHYERTAGDPRSSHALTLDVDDYGNVRKSLAVSYGRRAGQSPLDGADRDKQERTFISCTETDYTAEDPSVPEDWTGAYRTPLPCDIRTFEITGVAPGPGAVRLAFDGLVPRLAGLDVVPYERPADADTPARRLVERTRTRYRSNDLTGLLPPGFHGSLGLPGENYRLAFTPGLLTGLRRGGVPLLAEPSDVLGGTGADRGGYVDLDGDGHWWIPSGRVFYRPEADDDPAAELAEARKGFFLTRRQLDPFGRNALVTYDSGALLPVLTEDAAGNVVAAANDYRVLRPREVTDPNGNRTRVVFDALGLVVGTAVMGKAPPAEATGDSFDAFADLSPQAVREYFAAADPRPLAADHLGTATTRFLYDLEQVPVRVATISREIHESDLDGGARSPVQLVFGYSDGFGREVQRKAQAEPGPVPRRDATGRIVVGADGKPEMVDGNGGLRWVGSGWTIFTSKGKPIRKFEPFFSDTHALDSDTRIGVSPWLLYDPVDRVVATVRPDHSYEKVVFGPWVNKTYDMNDNVVQADGSTDSRADPHVGRLIAMLPAADVTPSWYERRSARPADDPGNDAAAKTRVHRQTPATAHLDALGRPFLTVARNRFVRDGAEVEESYSARTELDIQGNQRELRDDPGRLIMACDHDLLGNRVHQASMDAGERWTITDVTGKVIRAWDGRGIDRRLTYDMLRRPTGLFITEDGHEREAERTVYGEVQGTAGNHRTRVHQVFDGAGIVTNVAYDFRGNLTESRRDLIPGYRTAVDWAAQPVADHGSFTTNTTYDALSRPRTVRTPDGSVYRPAFNAAGLLETVAVNLRSAGWTDFVTGVAYDAHGRRTVIDYANGASTTYRYDDDTFRLIQLRTTRPAAADAPASRLFTDPRVCQDLSYTYDAAGHLTRIDDAAAKQVTFDNQLVRTVATFTYDATYRLVEATGREHAGQTAHLVVPPGGNRRDHDIAGLADLIAHPNDLAALREYTERYEYDAAGNIALLRHSARNGTWRRTYDYLAASVLEPDRHGNRLTATRLGNGVASTETYRYTDADDRDVNGCVTAINAMTLGWDADHRLREAGLGGGGTAYYVYDSAGQRVRKVVDDQNGVPREERLYLGGFEVYRTFGATAFTRETLHVRDGRQQIAIVETRTAPAAEAPVIRFQLGNHLGSAAVELDAAGALITYEEYHPYGTTAFQAGRSAAEVSLKRYRYTGKERDEETGLTYHGARYYAPWLGRWASCDPVWGTNLYVYARNDPIGFADPDGAEESSWGNRGWGALRAVGGLAQMVGGAAVFVQVEVPVIAQVAGGVAVAHGYSDLGAGLKQLISGRQERSLIEDTVSATAQALGAERKNADALATTVDIGLGFVNPAGPLSSGPRAGLVLATAGGRVANEVAATSKIAPVVEASREVSFVTHVAMAANAGGGGGQKPDPPSSGGGGSSAPKDPPAPKLLPNQVPEGLASELEAMEQAGVRPVDVSSPEFAKYANEGKIKWILTETGELRIIPTEWNGRELSHAAAAGGKSVIAAGEANVAVAGSDKIGTEISAHSGHYLNGMPASVSQAVEQAGREAFAKFGITFPAGSGQ